MRKIDARLIPTLLMREGAEEAQADAFLKWLTENRASWEAFEKYTLELIGSGKKLGAKAVAERVRWDIEIERGEEFKVNNNFVSLMARLFLIKYPEHKEYFETRELKGLKAA